MDTILLDTITQLHRNPEIDPQTFAIALSIKHITMLIASGGSHFGHPEDETSLTPQVIAQFIDKAMRTKGYFEGDWARLRAEISQVEAAWETGKQQFPKDLAVATEHGQEIDFYGKPDQVLRFYAEPEAHRYWPTREREQWFINGYMLAVRTWHAQQALTITE